MLLVSRYRSRGFNVSTVYHNDHGRSFWQLIWRPFCVPTYRIQHVVHNNKKRASDSYNQRLGLLTIVFAEKLPE